MLTTNQLQTIDKLIRSNLSKTKWIQQEEFIAEMTDHFVNGIDERMLTDQTFETALQEVYDGFGGGVGLKRLEYSYWATIARENRSVLIHNMLSYFTFPRLFISLPLIALLFYSKTEFQWVLNHEFWFNIFFTITVLLAWLSNSHSQRFGPFKNLAQRFTQPIKTISNWTFLVFLAEMFSFPGLLGNASAYVATFLYTVFILFYLSFTQLKQEMNSVPRQPD